MANSPRYSREIPHRYRLEAQKFNCGCTYLPNRYVGCTTKDTEFENIKLSGFGKILSWTIIHIAADNYSQEAPFAVAIIETDEGCRLTAQVIECNFEDIKFDARVELVFRKICQEGHSGILNYGYKAVLV